MNSDMATMVMPQPAWNLIRTPWQQRMFRAGNAVNAAWSASAFGASVRVLGFVGSKDANRYNGLVIPNTTVGLLSIPGVTRIDKINVRRNGSERHIRGHSTYRPQSGDVALLQSKVLQVAQEYVILTGALALGMPLTFYADETRDLHRLGFKVVLDVRSKELELALPFSPDVIKPNLDELSDVVGFRPDPRNDQQLLAIARRLLPNGLATFSLGPDGVFARAADGRAWRLRCDPPGLKIVHRVGCGDSFVGWLTVALIRGYDIPAALCFAVAAATANLTTIIPGFFPADLAFALVPEVDIYEVR